MRVYEFAKDNGLASKDVLALLEKNGYSVASHMSVLSEQAVQFLQKSFAKKQQVKEVKQPVKESSKPAPIIQSSPDKKKKIAVDKVAAPVKEPGFAQATPGKHPKEVVKKSPVIIKEEKIKPLKETHADLLEEEELSKPPLLVLEEEELNAPEEEQAPTEKIKASPEKKFASEKDVKAAVAKPRRFVSRKERNKFAPIAEKKEITEITLRNDLPLFEVAEMLGKQVGEIILILLKQGMVCNRNQLLSVDTISKLAQSFNITVHRESKK